MPPQTPEPQEPRNILSPLPSEALVVQKRKCAHPAAAIAAPTHMGEALRGCIHDHTNDRTYAPIMNLFPARNKRPCASLNSIPKKRI